MGDREGSRTRRVDRARGTFGSLGVVGAASVALLMLLSPLAAAGVHPAAFKGVVQTPSWGMSQNGCAKAKTTKPVWSSATGMVHWYGNATASACSKSVGGVGSNSGASADFSETLMVPVKFTATSTGVNGSWQLNMAWAEKIIGTATTLHCAATHSNYSYYASWLPSWVNTTSSYSYCSISASVYLYGSAYLLDTTNGQTMYPNNYWSGLSKNFYQYNDTSWSTTNYSSPAWWSNNYSSSYANGYRSGGTGSGTLGPAQSPTWWINGTFYPTHHYYLQMYLSGNINVYVNAIGHFSGRATLDASTGTHGATLAVAVY